MTLIHGDCIEVMAGMDPESVDAVVTDPPYGIGFMGRAWDDLSSGAVETSWSARGRNTESVRDPSAATPGGRMATGTGYAAPNPRCGKCGRTINGRDTAKGFKVCHCEEPTYAPTPNRQAQRSQEWHQQWAEAAYRVAKPSAYLLAFGGTRTVHRMTVALEDAGWIIRDMLVWGYASGFPKSKASLKPAWEPIVMARKPGPLRMLAIDECRIGYASEADRAATESEMSGSRAWHRAGQRGVVDYSPPPSQAATVTHPAGRWPANVILTDPIFDGGVEGVVGGGESVGIGNRPRGGLVPEEGRVSTNLGRLPTTGGEVRVTLDEGGTYSRFFLIPKADRADREPVLGGLPHSVVDVYEYTDQRPDTRPGRTKTDRPRVERQNVHPTVKPTDLMRHLVRLVTPTGGVVLDPFLGSGTTALAAEMEGFEWIGIEREAEYIAIAEARLNGTQRGLGLETA